MKENRIVAYGDSNIARLGNSLQVPIDKYLWEHGNPFSAPFVNLGREGMSVPRSKDEINIDIVRLILDQNPSVCIYLAGTIDLLRFIGPNPNELRSPDEFRQLVQDKGEEFIDSITEGIIEFHRRLKDLEIMPIAVTLPPLGRARFEQYDPIIKLQREVNKRMRAFPKRNGILCADVFSATAARNGFIKEEFYEDGIHLNPDGYKVMREVIFDQGVRPVLDNLLTEEV